MTDPSTAPSWYVLLTRARAHVKTACENALTNNPSLRTSLPRYIISFVCDVDRTLGTILYEDDVDWREIVERLRSRTGIDIEEWYSPFYQRPNGESYADEACSSGIDVGRPEDPSRLYTVVTYQTVPTLEALASDLIVFVMRGDRIVREYTTRSPPVEA